MNSFGKTKFSAAAPDNGLHTLNRGSSVSREAKSITLRSLTVSLIEVFLEVRPGTDDERDKLGSLRRKRGDYLYTDALQVIAGVDIHDPGRARRICEGITQHKHHLDSALGRNVGLEVAALDYMKNIAKTVAKPMIMEEDKIQRLASAVTHDDLTRTYTADTLDDDLDYLIRKSRENIENFSLLMLDLDNFKKFNDTCGHRMGNKALRITAKVMKKNLRPRDAIYRYGGDEFIILLPNTGMEHAVEVARRIRNAFCSKVSERIQTDLSLSTGVSVFDNKRITKKEVLIDLADRAMYRAKERSGGSICAARAPDDVKEV